MDADRLTEYIRLAIRELRVTWSHEAASCKDRLEEALMWAERARKVEP
jgi:hypothetical protein